MDYTVFYCALIASICFGLWHDSIAAGLFLLTVMVWIKGNFA